MRARKLVRTLQLGIVQSGKVIGMELTKVLFLTVLILCRIDQFGIRLSVLLVHYTKLLILIAKASKGLLKMTFIIPLTSDN